VVGVVVSGRGGELGISLALVERLSFLWVDWAAVRIWRASSAVWVNGGSTDREMACGEFKNGKCQKLSESA
jgi:hypothetical protein